jgi:hypothetical protein
LEQTQGRVDANKGAETGRRRGSGCAQCMIGSSMESEQSLAPGEACRASGHPDRRKGGVSGEERLEKDLEEGEENKEPDVESPRACSDRDVRIGSGLGNSGEKRKIRYTRRRSRIENEEG